MPRGGARPGAGRKPKNPAAAASSAGAAPARGHSPAGKKLGDAPPGWPFGTEPPAKAAEVPPEAPKADLSELTPLAYLLEVMRDADEERVRRMQAAQLAAPYCHAKKGEGGKKEERDAAAKKVASRFAPSAPPKLVANGGKVV